MELFTSLDQGRFGLDLAVGNYYRREIISGSLTLIRVREESDPEILLFIFTLGHCPRLIEESKIDER